ncbi:chloroplast envelope membrane protein-like, partial [Trifolium medium]|nr:chloroplast envelope membrane protein-like [Trifolium medium]
QEDARNQEAVKWEDWLLEDEVGGSSWEKGIKDYREEMRADESSFEIWGIVQSVRSLIFGRENENEARIHGVTLDVLHRRVM